MRARALGELSGFAPFKASVAGIWTRLLIRMRMLPFTIGAGTGFVTSCAAAEAAKSRQTAVVRSDLIHTLRGLPGQKRRRPALQFAIAPPIDCLRSDSTASKLIGGARATCVLNSNVNDYRVLMSKLASFVPPAGMVNRLEPSVKAGGTTSFCLGLRPSGSFGSGFTVVIITMYSPGAAPPCSFAAGCSAKCPSRSVVPTNGPAPLARAGLNVTVASGSGLLSSLTTPSTEADDSDLQPAIMSTQ